LVDKDEMPAPEFKKVSDFSETFLFI